MVRFCNNERYISLQIMMFVICCYRQSFSYHNNHRICYPPLARTAKTTSAGSTIRSIPALCLQEHRFNDGRVSKGHTKFQDRNSISSALCASETSTSSSSWDDLLAPSSAPRRNHKYVTIVDKAFIIAFGGSAIFTFLVLALKSPPGSWRYFLSGGLCAAFSHAIPTPVDVVKTRKQVDPRLTDKNFLEAGRTIIKEEGFRTLWAGLGPTTVGYLLEGAVKFGLYEVLKPALTCWLHRIASLSPSLTFLNSQFLTFILSAFVSGLAASFVLCPMEVIRIRLVSEPNFTSGGWVGGGYKILKQEGINGFTKGLNPMILKQVPYTVTKNVSFDLITKFFYSYLRQTGVSTISASMKFTIPLISAAIASVLSSLTSQPGDTILSLSCAHDGDKKTRDICRNIVRSERGISGFFVGTRTRLLHVGMIVTIQLLTYDYVKRFVGICATGL
mmetsp:Transcript_51154/g.52114  ORF Transcript_51154/g.52114 Transcript_51154/m.52114 type:complete len:445 (-) Transcript_51154:312-1646(-)